MELPNYQRIPRVAGTHILNSSGKDTPEGVKPLEWGGADRLMCVLHMYL